MADAEPPEKKQNAADAPVSPAAEDTTAPVEVTAAPSEIAAPQPEETSAPQKPRRPLKHRLVEQGIDVAGFGGVLKAWRAEGNRWRNVMKSLGTKAADMAAGRAVSTTMRLIAITWVAGMIGGVSTIGSMALLAVAAGVSSGIYSYHKDYFTRRFTGPKHERQQVKYLDLKRAKSAGLSFLSGTANGLFGAWLAKTGILQTVLGRVKDFVFTGGGLLKESFNPVAAPSTVAFGSPRHGLADAFSTAAADTRVAPGAPAVPVATHTAVAPRRLPKFAA